MTDTPLFTAGSLFTSDYLTHGITDAADYLAVDTGALSMALAGIVDAFPAATQPNEAQTEDDLIWPVLALLGWTDVLRQQNLTVSGREDVPDGLLFADAAAKAQANAGGQEWQRYGHGLAVVESKRWGRPLDRAGRRDEATAPSTQMLRYLRRIDDLTRGRLRWGILTNGGRWRLYWAGARSVSEEFLEIDLARVLGRSGDDLFAGPADREHWLRVFAVMFGRAAFLPDAGGMTFHARALRQADFYEERVAASLATLVFTEVFPAIAAAIARAAPRRPRRCRRCARGASCSSTACCSCSTPRTVGCCRSATAATTTMRCALCARTSAAAWARATPSPPAPRRSGTGSATCRG